MEVGSDLRHRPDALLRGPVDLDVGQSAGDRPSLVVSRLVDAGLEVLQGIIGTLLEGLRLDDRLGGVAVQRGGEPRTRRDGSALATTSRAWYVACHSRTHGRCEPSGTGP